MGLVIDTLVLILAERSRSQLDLGRYAQYGEAPISAVSASELLAGVHRASDAAVRARQLAFVEAILSALPTLPFDLEAARLHAELIAQMTKNETIVAHDALIAATALRHGCAVLSRNGKDFKKLLGVTVVEYAVAGT
jgi:tRNA(fMet)-specific endonuclease VapC